MDLSGFKALQKQSSRSFHDQKALIKRVMAGKLVKCRICEQQIELYLPEKNDRPGIRCIKGCTDVELDFSN